MISYVLLSNSFTRQLRRLHQGGGTAKAVAEHAEAIIQQWVSGEVKSPRQLTRSTRYGEGRIKNCWKYDLFEAYRLLTVMAKDHLMFLFVGSHDECDQWICHNRGWEPGEEKRENKILPVQQATLSAATAEAQQDEAAEDYLLEDIDEGDLRLIFSGICRAGAGQKQPVSVMRSAK